MEPSIKETIAELGVTIIDSDDLEKNAYYIPLLNLIILNSQLSDYERKKALLHELGHASLHQENSCLYQVTQTMHTKMEAEAEEYAAKKIVANYIEQVDSNPEQLNYLDFIAENELNPYLSVKVQKWFTETLNFPNQKAL
jgi:Zn-dependent peptidase ImmA (M78 family)